MNNLPLVSIIIPCWNEEKFISNCLDSIIANDYPKHRLEILVVDGMSNDGTQEILKKYIEKYHFIQFLINPKKITPSALNIGIKNAKGEIIIRMDAHATYEKDYVSKCVEYLHKFNADNVGGAMKTISVYNTLLEKAIGLVQTNRFGVGNSPFRTFQTQPTIVDTVFGGCWRREIFQRIGLFNENLARTQDMEFNLRLAKAGGRRIYLIPDIKCYYYVKSNFKSFVKHRFKDGIWAVYPLKFVTTPLKLRHYMPLIFVFSLINFFILSFFWKVFFYLFVLIVIIYFFMNIFFSCKIAVNEKDWQYFFLSIFLFTTLHISYGLGSILGLIKLFLPVRRS